MAGLTLAQPALVKLTSGERQGIEEQRKVREGVKVLAIGNGRYHLRLGPFLANGRVSDKPSTGPVDHRFMGTTAQQGVRVATSSDLSPSGASLAHNPKISKAMETHRE
jgi:hypothetical protein